jgi:sialate O-acetylesterase
MLLPGKKIFSGLILAFFLSGFCAAQLRMPSVFGNHMVLQQQSEVLVWGWADITEPILVTGSWDQVQQKSICSQLDGRWGVKLKTPQAGGPYTIIVKGNNKTLEFTDVMIGEVWVCSGQSNMEFKLPSADHGADEIALSKHPEVRFFKVPKASSEFPQDNCFGAWTSCTPEDMPDFSAVGYFFAKKLNETLKVPVGIINASWGGSPIEAWIPGEAVNKDSLLRNNALRNDNRWSPIIPGSLWNAMINPVRFYPIAGALWYQGEANVNQYETYSSLMNLLIENWRKAWNSELSFYYVQIAPYTYGSGKSAFLREQQTRSLSISATGMVITSDLVPDTTDIHPKRKLEVGIRLANLALCEHYKLPGLEVRSPEYDKFEKLNSGLRIYFRNCTNGLVCQGKMITGFELAGEDGRYFPASARIELGKQVFVFSADVKNPVSVRYCFKDSSIPNLFSKEGLPLNSFRAGE